MSARLGVDLGTTWTAAALSDGRNVEPLQLGASGTSMPSVVAIADGKPVAGDAAVRVGRDQPTAVAREFKRRLGDSTPIVLAGTPYGPEALTGHLLAHVLSAAGAVGAVSLTHPATWGEFKLDLLREAGRVAGLSDVELVPEPVAAAGHYARLGRLSAGDAVAVYDFGGGTFDAAIVRVGPNGPELLGRAEGLDRLGGLDLDQAVMAHVNAAVDGALTAMDRDNPDVRRAALELRAECVAAKEALSADTDTTIPVRFPGLNTEVRLTRAEFETAVRPRVAETLSALDRAVASAGLKAGDLAGVVLVGGTSRIPLVVEQVTAHVGRPVFVDADPKLSVATGAAEPNLRPASAIATATATREAAMSDTTRSTPPPPPGAKDSTSDGGGGAAAGAAGSGTPPPPPGARTGAPKPSERRTAAANAPKEKSGMSTGGKVAAGVAAAAAATAAGVLWHEDVTDALGLGEDDKPADDAATAEADAAAADAAAESMDAFDAVGGAGGGGGGGGGGFSGGGGGGGGGGSSAFAPPRPRAREQEAPDLPPPGTGAPQNMPLDPSFVAARNQLRERLETWTPPEGADPAEAAELRARLEGMIDRYQPQPGQSTDDAIAELRDEFDVRIDNFTQDLKIDDLVNEQTQSGQLDPEFTAQRQQLLDRLTNWTPPEGTTPERAAEIRAELQGLVERYRPIPGQPVDQAMAELQDRFDAKVEDFEQQDKIDILVGQEQGEQGTGTPGTGMPPSDAGASVQMPPGFMPDGTPIPGSDMDPNSPNFNFVKHEAALAQVEAAKAAAEAAGGSGTPGTATPGMETPGMETPGMETPGTATPGMETPGTGTPGTGTPGMETPGTGVPGTGVPGTGMPGMETPATETPGMETPAAETPATETPGMETPAAETPATETPATETPGMETPAAETPAAETPAAETPGTETPAAETPAAETPGMETTGTDTSAAEAPDPRVTMPRPDTMPDGTAAPSDQAAADVPTNTGIVPPHLQPEAQTSGLVDDFDAMVQEPAMAATSDVVGDAVADTGVLTAPAPAAADAAQTDVLGDAQVASAVAEAPTPDMASVGAPADAMVDVVGDSPPPLVDDFEFEMPAAAEPELTFEAPDMEPAAVDFEPEPEPEPAFDSAGDTSDDVLGT